MFGIVAVGDKQYKIVPGEACVFEKMDGEVGAKLAMKRLIMLSDGDGVVLEPSRLDRYSVVGTILRQYRENKVISYKKKRRKDYTRKRGHRQYKTLVMINSIELRN